METLLPPSGELRSVRFLDADGVELAQEEAMFHPFDHLPGGILLYPEPSTEVSSVVLDGSPPFVP